MTETQQSLQSMDKKRLGADADGTPSWTYTAEKPPLPESTEELRSRIPGWGADLDPADRPSVPKLQLDTSLAPWAFPERQAEDRPRERSVEHGMLTPVFGTAQPLHGLSGAIRAMAYRRYSEGRTAHWLLLVAADRVDVYESFVASAVKGRPDNLIGETGVQAELKGDGIGSRLGQKRADVVHHVMDPVVVMGPWVLAGVAGFRALRGAVRAVRK